MPNIYSYTKLIAGGTTHQMALPESDPPCQEIATVAGVTYVSVPDGVALPGQPPQIAASVQVVTPNAALRAAIKAASPHCELIKTRGHQRVVDAGYSRDDQAKLDRKLAAAGAGLIVLTPADLDVLNAYAAANLAADAWASRQYAELGL